MAPTDADWLEVRLDAHSVLQLLDAILEHDLGAVSMQLLRRGRLDSSCAGVWFVI